MLRLPIRLTPTSTRPLGLALVLGLSSCDGGSENDPAPIPVPTGPPAIQVDFGRVPHGEKPQKVVPLSFGRDVAGYRIAGFAAGCSCARASYRLTTAEGEVVELPIHGFQTRTLATGDRLALVMTLDTSVREVVDQLAETKVGRVMLSRGDFHDETIELPIFYSYAIDAPASVSPVAHLALGSVPRSRRVRDELRIRLDEPLRQHRLTDIQVTLPGLDVELHPPAGDEVDYRLEVAFQPSAITPAGPFVTHIEIDTDLPSGYRMRIPVSGEVLEDIVVRPMANLSFGHIDFRKPREEFLNITDYRLDRDPDFELARISEFAEHFDVRFEPIPGKPRGRRIFVRYLGTVNPDEAEGRAMRGQIYLKKPGAGDSIALVLPFVAFHRPQSP